MKVEESGIEFDFSGAESAIRHDLARPAGEGNTVWPGVDFRVDEGTREIWIEVKSWHPNRFKTVAERIEADRELGEKLSSEEFRHKIVTKFLGTTAYLAWTGEFAPKPLVYVIILDSSRRDRTALLGAFSQRLRASFPRAAPWTHTVVHIVTDLETFQAQFARYPCGRV